MAISGDALTGMKALYYVALTKDGGEKENRGESGKREERGSRGDEQSKLWLKSNQNRLNQNFEIIRGEIERIAARVEAIERQ